MKHRFLLFSLFLALAQLSVFADNRGRERVSASHLSSSALQQGGAAREGVLKHSTKRLAAQAESDTVQIPTIWGAMIYANSWQDESVTATYGIYAYGPTVSGPYLYASPVKVDNDIYANGSGAYYNGRLHFFTNNVDRMYQEWDYKTWQRKRFEYVLSSSLMATDADYDEVTGQVYGCFYNPSTSAYDFAAVEYSNGIKSIIRPCDMYIAVAARADGSIYAIKYKDSSLYRIDKETGEETLIGETGIKVGDYLQSATFDRTADVMYWAASDETGTTMLCTVNVETGRANVLAHFADAEQLSCLYVPYIAAAGAPAQPADAQLNFAGAALEGTVSFTMPATATDGAALSGELTYKVTLNGKQIASETAQPGAAVEVPVAAKEGVNLINIVVSNAAGASEPLGLRRWIGNDTPKAPTYLTLTIDNDNNNQADLTWKAPTEGIHAGYVNPMLLRYDVVRLPDSARVATDLATPSFTEILGNDKPGSWKYAVTAKAAGLVSQTAVSNVAIATGVFTPPYCETFDTQEAFNAWTVIDSNNDSYTWAFNKKANMAQYTASMTTAGDDWLISPKLALNAENSYDLSYIYKGYSDVWPEKMEVCVGTGDDPTAYTVVVAPHEIGNYDRELARHTFSVPQTGNYRLAFHALSQAKAYYLYIDSVRIAPSAVKTAPGAITNLVVAPNALGEPKADISFVAPAVTTTGEALTAIDRIEIVRRAKDLNGDPVTVKTFEAPAVGEALQFTDTAVPNGWHTYEVTPYNAQGRGQTQTADAFVGEDMPKAPQAVGLAENADGTFTLSWTNPGNVGENGQYVNPEHTRFNVYTTDIRNFVYDYKSGLTGGSLLIADTLATGPQQQLRMAVKAQSVGGESPAAYSNYVLAGAPYALPYVESFAGAEAGTYCSSDGYNPFRLADNISYDNDGGCIGWKSNGLDNEGSFEMGKISLKNAAHPYFIYAYYALPGEEGTLTTYVTPRGGSMQEAGTLDFKQLAGEEGWRVQAIDLSQWTGSDYVRITLTGRGTDIYVPIYVDRLRVEGDSRSNLRVSELSVPTTLKTQMPQHIIARVENTGAETSAGYTLHLLADGNTVLTKACPALAGFSGENIVFDYQPAVSLCGKEVALSVQLVPGSEDADASDNASETKKAEVLAPEYPAIHDLSYLETGGAHLEWTQPEQVNRKVEESFETYRHKDTVFAPWTTIDAERGLTYTNTQMDAGPSNEEASFWVFNPTVAACTVDNLPYYTPYDGYQCLMATSSQPTTIKIGDRNDDWLISPELGSCAQTVSFMARTAKEKYGLEDFEILYSTTYPYPECFTLLTAHTAPEAWTRYTADLPEGTRYFAIRYRSQDKFIFLVDMVCYETGVMPVRGYNVYCNGKLIASLPATQLSYDLTQLPDEAHAYTVTVVYENGESAPSNVANSTTGIVSLAPDAEALAPALLYDASGRRVSVPVRHGVTIDSKGGKRVAKQ